MDITLISEVIYLQLEVSRITVVFPLVPHNLQYSCTYMSENKFWLCTINQQIFIEKEVPYTDSEHCLTQCK